MVSLNQPVRRRRDVETTDLTDALLLTEPGGQGMFGVNFIGRRIIGLLELPQTVESLVAELGREFTVEPAQCESDVREFLTELADRGLIENG